MIHDAPRPMGRPMKYAQILASLEDDELYTPAMIADFGLALGFRDRNPNVNEKLLRTRIRINLAHLARSRHFPKEGDGSVMRWGQAPTPGWLGNRWKETIPEEWEVTQ